MNLSSIPVLCALFALTAASLHTQEVAVVCTDPALSTVTQTVTVTAAPSNGANNNQITTTSPLWVNTQSGMVTSVDYHGSTTSVWVYPTGSPSYNCTVSVWVNSVVITVINVNINVTVINGATTTVTSTVSGSHPIWTPSLPGTPANATATASMPIGTGYSSINITTSSMPAGTGVSGIKTTTLSAPYGTGIANNASSISSKKGRSFGTGSFPRVRRG